MTEDNQPLDENEESTLNEERESEDVSEDESLEDLFEDESEDENESDADKVKRLEEKIARIEKGVKKLATDKGRQKADNKGEPQKDSTSSVNDEVIEELLLTKHPEAENVLDELKQTAQMKGVSILKLFRESKYFQGEAKSLADAKKVEEEAKSKIKTPTNGTAPQKQDISKVKPEEVSSLKPADKMAWIKAQAEKERNSDE